MKIYNKKGFIFGLIWTVLGVWLLINSFIKSESITIELIKDIVLVLILLAVGITSVYRAFSKKATREDYIEQNDERNKLVKLKTKSRMLDLMVFGIIILMIIGLIGYMATDNIAWGFLFFGPCLLLAFYWIAYIVVNIYYENKE